MLQTFEWLENVLTLFGLDSNSAILYTDTNLSQFAALGPNFYLTLIRRVFNGVT